MILKNFCIFIFVRTYRKHNKSVHLINYHIIWCPKYRRGILIGDLKLRLERIIRDAIHEKRGETLALEIMPDHVHLCVSLPPDVAPHKAVKLAKGRSSNYLRKEFPFLLKMPTLWSRSYFISSVGNVSTEQVMEYIENQWKK